MSNVSYRLWYFEAHLAAGLKAFVNADGESVDIADVIQSSFAGTERQAHTEADRRCGYYDKRNSVEARAMSFSPLSTLAENASAQEF